MDELKAGSDSESDADICDAGKPKPLPSPPADLVLVRIVLGVRIVLVVPIVRYAVGGCTRDGCWCCANHGCCTATCAGTSHQCPLGCTLLPSPVVVCHLGGHARLPQAQRGPDLQGEGQRRDQIVLAQGGRHVQQHQVCYCALWDWPRDSIDDRILGLPCNRRGPIPPHHTALRCAALRDAALRCATPHHANTLQHPISRPHGPIAPPPPYQGA
mmetsp:Transcript_10599/g.24692  ORF Transcript_10599/g.24692 Transcript_10599/m.24692 type:complete len:214 (-) Transcript_10599:648-1289(-)